MATKEKNDLDEEKKECDDVESLSSKVKGKVPDCEVVKEPKTSQNMAGTRMFVRGIGEDEKECDLERLFTKLKGVSRVSDCEIMRDTSTGLCRGFGYVTIYVEDEKTLNRCLKVYNGTKWKGNVLRVEIAKEHYMKKLKREWELERQEIERSKNILDQAELVERHEKDAPSTLYICKKRHPEKICVSVDLLEPFSTVNASGDPIQRTHLQLDDASSYLASPKRKREILQDQEDSQLMSKRLKSKENVVSVKSIEKVKLAEEQKSISSDEEESSSDEEEVNNHDDTFRPDDGSMFKHIQSMLENSENGIDAEELAQKLKGRVDSSVITTLLAD